MQNNDNVIFPPAKIGVIGGGQLGRMLAFETKKMGYELITLDPKLNCPTAQVCDKQIVGSLYDQDKIRELANQCDVLTYEFEFLDTDVLCQLESEGYKIFPSGRTLKKIQNKYIQKSLFKDANLPVPKFIKINNRLELNNAIEELGLPAVLKCCTGGYDGKGNFVIKTLEDAQELDIESMLDNVELMLEEFIPFRCEISMGVARNMSGEVAYYPLGENEHYESILKYTKVPANVGVDIEEKAINVVGKIMDVFNDVGMFCVELFVTDNNEIYINEVAPRPHNSTHYTIEACKTSQFEQQLRAITGLPLGSTDLISPVVMANLLGEEDIDGKFKVTGLENLLVEKGVHFHYYGKESVGVKRKIGHITVLDENTEKAETRAKKSLENINIISI